MFNTDHKITSVMSIIFISMIIGISSGLFSTLFLNLLFSVTKLRSNFQELILFLPLFGLLLAFIIIKIPKHINEGVPYLLQAQTQEDKKISLWMAPYILLTSVGTHLFGGSAGREGVGVIMGISLSEFIPTFFNKIKISRKDLIHTGIAAGFSSIFGTPLAAIIFALEINNFKRLKNRQTLILLILSSLIAYYTTVLLKLEHHHIEIPFTVDKSLIVYIIISGLLSGLGAQLFFYGMKYYSKFLQKILPNLYLKFFLGSILISCIIYFSNGFDYAGIGVNFINESFDNQRSFYDFFMKITLTVMTLSIGFKGGEVTPLFFMGATLSNSILSLMGYMNYALSSGLGMISFFGAASSAPIASALMGAELFGYEFGLIVLISCFIAKSIMRKKSIYSH